MSALADAQERIGDMASVASSKEGWRVPCRVLDVRANYGRIDYLCMVDGERVWIAESRLTSDGE